MAGAGQPQIGISVPQGPLVTPAMPSGQDAVDSMVNAFRRGTITSQEIVDRFGLKARAQTQAATSAAELGQMQAEAQKPLVEPMAQLAQAKTASELASTNWGQGSLKMAQETMGWFGDDFENYRDSVTGRTDFQKLAKVGAQRVAILGQVDRWSSMLKPVSSRVIELGDGTQKTQYLNAYNQDVTPPSDGYDGSEQYWHYVTQLEKFMPPAHPLAGMFPMKYDPSLKSWDPKNSKAAAAGHPMGKVPSVLEEKGPFVKSAMTMPQGEVIAQSDAQVYPENPKLMAMRAALVKPDGSNAREVSNMTPQQVVEAQPVADLVQQATAAVAQPPPVITPATPPAATPPEIIAPTKPLPGQGGITTKFPQQTVWTQEKIRGEETKLRDSLIKEPPVQNWLASIPYQKTFEINADQLRNLTPDQQRATNLNVVDTGLAESLIKLYDPQGVIREFKWDKLTSHQPTLDVLRSGPSLYIQRKGTFTPETRQELIRMGEEIISGREKAVAPFMAKTVKQAESIPGAKIENILTSEDARILAAKNVAGHAAAAPLSAVNFSNSPGPGWELRTLSSVGPIWRKTGSNLFIPAKK